MWNGKQAALTRLPNITGHPEVKQNVRNEQGKHAASIVATKRRAADTWNTVRDACPLVAP